MTTYCALCRSEIPRTRQVRSARTCSNTCQAEYKRQKRAEQAKSKCRYCGRRIRQRPEQQPWRTPPNDITGESECKTMSPEVAANQT